MTEDGVLADLDRHFRACGLEGHGFPGVEIVLWGGSGETPPDAEIIQLAAQAHEREFRVEAPLLGQLAATDGWWFSRASIPTVIGLGPGGVAGCHVIDEHVDVTELERYACVYADVIASFLGTDG
jgi:acetylornithine deacetylase/succinyl-diaminopimelate desuccinylase-like protein